MPDSHAPSSPPDPANTAGRNPTDPQAAIVANLSPEARENLLAELDPGESVLWCGQPDPTAAAKRTAVVGGLFGLWMILMLAIAVAAFRTIHAELQEYAPAIASLPQGDLPDAELAAAFCATVGALCIGTLVCWGSPFLAYGLARRTLYAVTNTRVLRIVRLGRSTQTRAFEPRLPLVVSRSESPGGTGSLTVGRYSTTRPGVFGIEHIQDSREAERVICRIVSHKSGSVAAPRDEAMVPAAGAIPFDTTLNQNLNRLPNSTRQFLQSQLQPGESVLWADQPDVAHSLKQLRWAFKIMWIVTIVTIALIAAKLSSTIGESRGSEPWLEWMRSPSPPGRSEIVSDLFLMITTVACLPLVAWMPRLHARSLRLSTYALTNKRILVLTIHHRRFFVRSLLPARPLDSVCSGLRNGAGNLALARSKWGTTVAFTLHNVPRVCEVERLIRETFDPAPSQPAQRE